MTNLDAFEKQAKTFNIALRRYRSKKLNYLILVPTLRCNLKCSYCQVSRADENAAGYDWTHSIAEGVKNYILKNATNDVKIEFQGGEPTLRPDLLKYIIDEVSSVLSDATFVICSNLQKLSPEILSLIDNELVSLSCSLDGPPEIHKKNRTFDNEMTGQFFANLDLILDKYGPSKISLVPTIADYTKIKSVIDFYYEKGLTEIFLRPVNYQGFARKQFSSESDDVEGWIAAYSKGVNYIFSQNDKVEKKLVEATFSIHISKIFNPSKNGYVDLRNPNPLGRDYLVIDYDGVFYPTDESRMLSRIGAINLKIGDLENGLDINSVNKININNNNFNDPDCNNCGHQIHCGVDNIDKISRYGTIDIPTRDTFFCKNHMSIFDFVYKKIAEKDLLTIKNLNLHLTGAFDVTSLFSGIEND
jgi:His-Xaa-Ser system radical SAM maturase HxsB